MTNRQWALARHPSGMPVAGDWAMREVAVPSPEAGQVLCRSIYLDVAPYMRGRISPQKNYAAGVSPGDTMIGGAIAEVVESRIDGIAPGQLVVSDFNFGWQEFACLQANDFRLVDPEAGPLRAWLDVLGLNGVTAYFGLLERGAMRAGDTVLVSAASGSVGQLVGQIAKIAGGKVIGVTSSAQKALELHGFGYDHAIAYQTTRDLSAAIAAAAPKGIDLFFDNTAGEIHDAVMQNLAPQARIVICGTVSLAGKFDEPDIGQRFLRQILVARAEVKGFLAVDYAAHYPIARRRLGAWMRESKLQSRYDIAEGFDAVPDAFIRLLTSQNTGKQLVQVRPEPD